MRSLLAAIALSLGFVSLVAAGDWPAWRGPSGDGVAPDEKNPPLHWSATENITWKAALPSGGNSTPIVLGDRVFITCARDGGRVRSVMCFDRAAGKILWQGDTPFTGDEPTHEDNPYCSASPVTDGSAVYAWHGSAGVVAYDLAGVQRWRADLGLFKHIWGNASSPLLYKQTVILQCGPGPRCFLVALDKSTGKPTWTHDLPDAAGKDAKDWTGSWSSPVLRALDGGKQELVAALPDHVAGFDPDTGEERWRCRGLSNLAYANPLIGKNVIVVMSGYGGPALGLRAPAPDARGDLTATHRLWLVEKNQQRIGSGVLLGGRVYILNEPGIAQCIDAASGKLLWKERAAGSTWASTACVDGKLFTTDASGETDVWSPGDKLTLLAQNPIGERTRASLAFSDGQVFLRTYKHLYCIGQRRSTDPVGAAQ